MATSSTCKDANTTTWETLIENARKEIFQQIKQDKPDLLDATFFEPLKFLPHSHSTHMITERWLQLEHNRMLIANTCKVTPAEVTIKCVESSAPFVCLKVEKPGQISKPVPDKTLVIIAIGQLHPGNGMFTKVNLSSGKHVILSGNETQIFPGTLKGGGIGVLLHLKFKPK